MLKDSLTGLLNHSRVLEQLDHELRRATRLNQPLSVAMIDIDHFKSINDTGDGGQRDPDPGSPAGAAARQRRGGALRRRGVPWW
jgi:hypothetical protein